MSRNFTSLTIEVLAAAGQENGITASKLYNSLGQGKSYKDFYNILFRLSAQELLEKRWQEGKLTLSLTKEGEKLLKRRRPERDGIWKLVIFDIPEKHKYVRAVLRAKLKSLGFKKWQNSIWISPFGLEPEIEKELGEIGKKFFVRLIKTRSINIIDDLEKNF